MAVYLPRGPAIKCIFYFKLVLCFALMNLFSIHIHAQLGKAITIATDPVYEYVVEEVDFPIELNDFKVLSFYQDREGFMWLGGVDGVIRYDGVRFKTFEYDPFDKHSVPITWVFDIQQDDDNFIWLTGRSGLIKYDPGNGRFRRFINPAPPNGNLEWNMFLSMTLDHGSIWLGTQKGLCRFDTEREIFDSYTRFSKNNLDVRTYEWVRGVFILNQDSLLVRIGEMIAVFDKRNGNFSFIPNSDPGFAPPCRDNFDRIWIPNWNGLFILENNPLRLRKYNFAEEITTDINNTGASYIIHDNDESYWIITEKRIIKLNGNLEAESIWKYEFEMVHDGIMSYMFEAPVIDNSGTLWYSTPEGPGKIIRKKKNFHVYDQQPNVPWDLKTISFRGDFMWIADYRNIYKCSKDLSEIKIIPVIISGNGMRSFKPVVNQCIFSPPEHIWVGTYGDGVFLCENIEEEHPDFLNVFPGTSEIPDGSFPEILSLFEDSQGRIWIGIKGELPCFYDPVAGRIQYIKFPKIYDYPIDFYISIHQECDSGILIGSTSKGVFAMRSSFRQVSADTVEAVEYYNYPLQMMEGLHYDVIRLYKPKYGEEHILWATTSSEALLKLKIHGKIPGDDYIQIEKVYTKKEGLNTKRQQSIIEDHKGIIWIGGDKGITRFDPVNELFRLYSACDGFTSADFRENSVAISPEGELFYGTDIALVSFHPDSIELNTKFPPVKITDVLINNMSILNDSSLRNAFYNPGDYLKLKYQQNNLLFEFASLNFIHPFKNQYRYTLDGFDDTWISTGNTAHAEFFNLKPGKYVFHVKASNNDGIWNDEGVSFHFLIKRPFWFSYPAMLFYLIFVIITSYLYKRYIVGKAQLESEILIERHNREKAKEVDQLKSRFFTNISHEFRTPLTLVAGPLEDSLKMQGEVVSMDKKILRLMLRNARRLQRLINQLLDISKIESGTMHLQLTKGRLPAFVRTIASSFLSLAESSSIAYQISVQEVEGELCFDADKLEKIIANLLSNAFKFTIEGGTVSLELTFSTPEGSDKPRRALLKISDTGKGIDKAHLDRIFDRFYQVSDNDTREVEGSGIGLALTKELVELMHGEIEVKSEPGKGTCFRVVFPVSEECFSEKEIEAMESRGKVDIDIEDEVGDEDEVDVNDEVKDEIDLEGRKEDNGLHGIRSTEEMGRDHEMEMVLVVEDNADLRMYIREQFRKRYRVVEVTNGREGLEKAIGLIPDLVVTDIMMPVMDGVEMCRRLKSHPATNHIPVIMLTAKADKESRLTGLEASADDYIVKPFDSELLLARSRNLISQRKELRLQFEKTFLLEGDPKASASPSFQMLREVLQVFDRHLSDPDFNIEILGKELKMSRSQLFRKVHSITGATPNELLRLVRMKHAARLLRKGTMNIAQVMYEVGMQSPSYFASSFRKYFEVNPKAFGKGVEDKESRHRDNA